MVFHYFHISQLSQECGSDKIFYCAYESIITDDCPFYIFYLSSQSSQQSSKQPLSPAAPSCPTWWTNTRRRTPAREVTHCKAVVKMGMLYLLWCLTNIASMFINVIMLLINKSDTYAPGLLYLVIRVDDLCHSYLGLCLYDWSLATLQVSPQPTPSRAQQ